MARNPRSLFSQDEHDQICKSIAGNESDRGSALVGAALLDDLLSELLTAFFVDDAKRASSLLGLTNDGPLATFAARTKLAYLLGLIGKDVTDDLDRIRDIRNAFAHSRKRLDFQDGKIKSWCENLKSSAKLNKVATEKHTIEEPIVYPRDLFTLTCIIIAYDIIDVKANIKHRKISEDPEILGLISDSEDPNDIDIWLSSVRYVEKRKDP